VRSMRVFRPCPGAPEIGGAPTPHATCQQVLDRVQSPLGPGEVGDSSASRTDRTSWKASQVNRTGDEPNGWWWESGQRSSRGPAMRPTTTTTVESRKGEVGNRLSLRGALPPGPIPVQVMVQVPGGDPVKPPRPEEECRPERGQFLAPGLREWVDTPPARRTDGSGAPPAGTALALLVQESLVSKTVLRWNPETSRPPDQAHEGVAEGRERSARPPGFECHVEHDAESGAGCWGRPPRDQVWAPGVARAEGAVGPSDPMGPGQEKNRGLGKPVALAMGDPPFPRWRPGWYPDRLPLAGVRHQELRHRENPVALPPEFLPVVVSDGSQQSMAPAERRVAVYSAPHRRRPDGAPLEMGLKEGGPGAQAPDAGQGGSGEVGEGPQAGSATVALSSREGSPPLDPGSLSASEADCGAGGKPMRPELVEELSDLRGSGRCEWRAEGRFRGEGCGFHAERRGGWSSSGSREEPLRERETDTAGSGERSIGER
jgi:hypothetical protein